MEAEEGGFITACLLKLSISVAENDRQVSCGETLAKSRLAYEIHSLIGSDISRAFFYPPRHQIENLLRTIFLQASVPPGLHRLFFLASFYIFGAGNSHKCGLDLR